MRSETHAIGKNTQGPFKVLVVSVLFLNLGGNYKVLLCYYYLKCIQMFCTLLLCMSMNNISHNKKTIREYSFTFTNLGKIYS